MTLNLTVRLFKKKMKKIKTLFGSKHYACTHYYSFRKLLGGTFLISLHSHQSHMSHEQLVLHGYMAHWIRKKNLLVLIIQIYSCQSVDLPGVFKFYEILASYGSMGCITATTLNPSIDIPLERLL